MPTFYNEIVLILARILNKQMKDSCGDYNQDEKMGLN